MASDIDRNIFFVPLEQRKKQLEQIPWVQSASVMRLLPNRLKIDITERTPVAFVEIGSHIAADRCQRRDHGTSAGPGHASIRFRLSSASRRAIRFRRARRA